MEMPSPKFICKRLKLTTRHSVCPDKRGRNEAADVYMHLTLDTWNVNKSAQASLHGHSACQCPNLTLEDFVWCGDNISSIVSCTASFGQRNGVRWVKPSCVDYPACTTHPLTTIKALWMIEAFAAKSAHSTSYSKERVMTLTLSWVVAYNWPFGRDLASIILWLTAPVELHKGPLRSRKANWLHTESKIGGNAQYQGSSLLPSNSAIMGFEHSHPSSIWLCNGILTISMIVKQCFSSCSPSPKDRNPSWPPWRGDAPFTEGTIREAGNSPLRLIHENGGLCVRLH